MFNSLGFVCVFFQVGPRNTRITAFPGNVLLEANELTLSCATESYPPASVVWKKQLADTTVQHIAESHNITIPNVQFYDSGIYICEVTNEITNETENRTMPVTVQGMKWAGQGGASLHSSG